MTYIRRERDWVAHAIAEGRLEDPADELPELPPSLAGPSGGRDGAGRQ